MPSPFDKTQQAHVPAAQATLAITLVPGTWAYGIFRRRNMFAPATPPRWFEHGSTFRALLESELSRLGFTYTLDVHQWDGANSVRSRAAQADRLAATIKAQQSPGLRRVIIGHSHGGTIACRAASLIPAQDGDLSVITLSTPFLQASTRTEDSPRYIVIMFFILLVLTALEGFIGREGGTRMHLLPRFLGVCLLFVGFFFYRLREEEDKLADLINTRVTCGPRLLVMRGFSDEASNSLVLGSVGAGLMNGLFYTLAFPARWFLFGAPWRLFAAMAGYFALIVLLVKKARLIFDIVPLWSLVAGLAALCVVPLVIAGFFSLLYGHELFFQALSLLFTVDSVPDSEGSADVVTLSATQVSATGLRHGLYAHGGCARMIAYWLATGRTWHYFNAVPYDVTRPSQPTP